MKVIGVRIEGRVQGVWFRRHLQGWVRNRSDGSVEAVFAGPEADVEAMVAACWQGPPAARVTRVVPFAAALPERSGFHAIATL
jgi:acylphosphatase